MPLPLRIFISATLEDLKTEREAVLKVLSEFNEQVVVESMEKWGSADPPPKEESLKILEKCNIYVGVIGLKYGAVTEDEYERACEIPDMKRLLYVRSTDAPISPKFVESDPERLQKLNQLKERIMQERTLFFFSDANELARRVYGDINKWLTGVETLGKSYDDIPVFQKKWLSSRGLAYNPFNFTATQWETNLARYYVQLGNLQLITLQNSPQNFVIFGPSGAGKTALCLMIANGCYPKRRVSKSLALPVDVGTWENIWYQVRSVGPAPFIYAQQLLKIGYKELKGITLESRSQREYERKLDDVQKFIENESPKVGNVSRNALELLVEVASLAGFEQIVCLVDQVNEISGIEDNYEKISELIAPLMSATFCETQALAFRFFLPVEMSEVMQQKRNAFHLSRMKTQHISWNSNMLKALLSERLKDASDKRLSALWELCGKDLKLIDEYITHASISNLRPRSVIWLANRLIETHCEPEMVVDNKEEWEPAYDIDFKTWIKVRLDWGSWGQKQTLGELQFDSEGFAYRDGKCYFENQEISLKNEHRNILSYLILAQNVTCSKELLIQAAWPGELTTRNDHHLQVEISRLKESLAEQDIPDDWIQTVRAYGYQLSKPVQPRKSVKKRKKKHVAKN